MPDFGDQQPGDGSRHHDFGTVDPYAPSVANGQISPAEWARYQSRRRRDAILGSILTVGGMFGAQPLANALGVGATSAGSAAGGTLPGASPWAVTPYAGTASMSAPGASVTAGSLGTGSGLFGGSQGVTFGSQIPAVGFEASPYVAGASMAPTGAAGSMGAGAATAAGTAAAAEGARKYLGLTARDWLALGGAGMGAIGALTSDPANLNPNTATTDPNLQRLIESMQRRLDKSEPLYDSVLAMSNGLLPTRYQRGPF